MRRHDYDQGCDQFTLESFLSDDSAIVTLFKNEVAQCESALDRTDDCHRIVSLHRRRDQIGFAANRGKWSILGDVIYLKEAASQEELLDIGPGVNLRAEEEEVELTAKLEEMEREKADVEEAIARLNEIRAGG